MEVYSGSRLNFVSGVVSGSDQSAKPLVFCELIEWLRYILFQGLVLFVNKATETTIGRA